MRRWNGFALRLLLLATALVFIVGVPAAQETRDIPSPERFFGFPMGAEGKLAGWTRIVEYFQTIDRASDRVLVQEIGKTTLGKPYLMAIVSEPQTIANLAKYRAMQKALADPRRTTAEEAARIAREGKVVLLVGLNVHSNEIGSSQMGNALLHHLATDRSLATEHILRNVILLLVPSQNPDGQQLVVDWYDENAGTAYEDAPLPELYHKYAGHDNNRDSYMLTQVETRHLNRITYHDWLPEVYLDEHQMGNTRARIFVPPFKNPPNPNVDPLVWSQVNLLGQAMAAKLHEAGKTGVIWGEQYTGFWQGANSTNPWFHNMVSLLSEVASSRLARSVTQRSAAADHPADRRGGGFDVPPDGRGDRDRDTSAPLPAPSDVQYRMNYLDPWLGGTWTPADVVDYHFISTLGLLEAVANNREMLKRNFHLMNRRAIDLYAKGGPFAYVVPPEQRDPVAAAKLLELLQAGAAEVHRASTPFEADDHEFPAGSHVILLAQPFGRWVKDLLEPQVYPDIRWPVASAPLDRPYDVTAWTLGMLMGVETTRIDRPFEAQLTRLGSTAQAPAGRVAGQGPFHVISHSTNNSIVAINRLLKDGAEISWAMESLDVDGQRYEPGAILVSNAKGATLEALARELRLDVTSVATLPARVLPIRAPRIAVYEPWGGNMDAGWTRWLLEQHEFPYTQVRNADLRTPDLNTRFDVIMFPEMSATQIVRGLEGRSVRPEHQGGIGEQGVRHVREFITAGGTAITLGNAAEFAINQLGAPFKNVVENASQDEFLCPGCILRIAVDTEHPVGYGMPEHADVMFISNGGYRPTTFPAMSTRTIARYPTSTLLRSGLIIGEDRLRGSGAVLEATMGRGRIIMHTFRVQSRGQTWGTFKLLFNSIFYGPAAVGRQAPDSSELSSSER